MTARFFDNITDLILSGGGNITIDANGAIIGADKITVSPNNPACLLIECATAEKVPSTVISMSSIGGGVIRASAGSVIKNVVQNGGGTIKATDDTITFGEITMVVKDDTVSLKMPKKYKVVVNGASTTLGPKVEEAKPPKKFVYTLLTPTIRSIEIKGKVRLSIMHGIIFGTTSEDRTLHVLAQGDSALSLSQTGFASLDIDASDTSIVDGGGSIAKTASLRSTACAAVYKFTIFDSGTVRASGASTIDVGAVDPKRVSFSASVQSTVKVVDKINVIDRCDQVLKRKNVLQEQPAEEEEEEEESSEEEEEVDKAKEQKTKQRRLKN